jgi:hypothetical protein
LPGQRICWPYTKISPPEYGRKTAEGTGVAVFYEEIRIRSVRNRCQWRNPEVKSNGGTVEIPGINKKSAGTQGKMRYTGN